MARERDLALSKDEHSLRAESDRSRAAANRVSAAQERVAAAADRARAADDRWEAARLRIDAQQTLELAASDELTGAWTRRQGLAGIEREIERAHRTDGILTLAFVDVEGLKEVNDTLGHPEGDRLLRRVAETMKANVRGYDVIVRYGGDEFLCAMSNFTRDGARERMEKIASTLATVDEQHSIAFGFAERNPDEDLDGLISRADSDLLEARRIR